MISSCRAMPISLSSFHLDLSHSLVKRDIAMKRCLGLLLAACLLAQGQHDHPSATNAKPAELLEGLGNHVHPIATKSELAQRFFNQGFALIYGFNHDEAARLF